jgi:hypothetical protein
LRTTFDRMARLYHEVRPATQKNSSTTWCRYRGYRPRVGYSRSAAAPIRRRSRSLTGDIASSASSSANDSPRSHEASWPPIRRSWCAPAPSKTGRRRKAPSTSPSRQKLFTGSTSRTPTGRSPGDSGPKKRSPCFGTDMCRAKASSKRRTRSTGAKPPNWSRNINSSSLVETKSRAGQTRSVRPTCSVR